ncbi:MAG: hypothetical protein K1X74_05720 [Pirellulales bacterium]|nr:hypothetical protein [Pirellulales bacterium]
MRQTILALRHAPHETLGMLELLLAERGLGFEYVDTYTGACPPPDRREPAGVVVLGGPMNVDQVDEYPFLAREPRWIAEYLAAGTPLLGICLGAQLVAKSLGARVFAAPRKEIGWYDIELLPAAEDDPLFHGLDAAQRVFQWHGDTFDPPPGTVHLARSQQVAQQAYRAAPLAWGLQFHAEVDRALVDDWLDEPAGRCEIEALDYIDSEAIRRRADEELPRMHALSRTIFGRWADLCRGRR